MILTKEELKYVLSTNLLKDFCSENTKLKAAIMIANTMVGKKHIYKEISNMFYKSFRPKQKDLREVLEKINHIEVYAMYYDYIFKIYNSEKVLNNSFKNKLIARKLYKVINMVALEEFEGSLNGVKFIEYIHVQKEHSILKGYEEFKTRDQLYDPIRNNIMLVFLRNPHLKEYADFDFFF